MPVLGIPQLCTIGAHSNSMGNNHERSFPRDRLDACGGAQDFETSYVHMKRLQPASVRNSPGLWSKIAYPPGRGAGASMLLKDYGVKVNKIFLI